MLINAMANLRGILHVQIWENRLKVTNLLSNSVFDQAPNIAIKTKAKGGKEITAYGNEALVTLDKDTISYNPFSHPRMLLADVIAAQELLKLVFNKTKSSVIFSPIVIIQPMEKLEGNLTYLERREFKSLAINSGAKEAYIYEADKKFSDEVTADLLKRIILDQISHDELIMFEKR
ncbi:hypothetical protein ACMXYN_10350 [Neptuniibacter sp. PT8_73]|uniref:hypothetical protein n=1 Tax=unclassified Neptuniibacter TaxID=2630693 RepID=UPI0039F6F4D7